MSGIQYNEEDFAAVEAVLASSDLIMNSTQVYGGEGVAKLFQVQKDVVQVRIGRRHCEGHEDFKFNEKSGSIMASLTDTSSDDYTVFIPLTKSNVFLILKGETFLYHVAKEIKEDENGFLISLVPEEIQPHTGNLNDLVALMPKKKILGAGLVDVKIGTLVVKGVKSSNLDDAGDVLINSLNGMSSVLYNSLHEEPFRPSFNWGSNGWKEPVVVSIEGDRVFFDERRQQQGRLWLLKFQEEGYEAIAV